MSSLSFESPLPGVRQYFADPSAATPHLAILGGVHGNEVCGVTALRWLEEELQAKRIELTGGTLTLIDGNLQGLEQHLRHTREGADLNRLWDFQFEERLKEDAFGYEHHRALALRGVFEGVDAVLDLHSTSSATPPFAISNGLPASDALLQHLGTPFGVRAWESLADRVLIGFLAARSVPAVVVECGQHQAISSVDVATEVALRFLATHRILKRVMKPVSAPCLVRVVETITRPSSAFNFSQPFSGFQRIMAGTTLGRDQLTEVRVHQDCFAVLPNPEASVGEDMVYLAIEEASPGRNE